MTECRVRHRQGPVRVIGDVPYPNRESTLSLLPGAVVGRWLASRSADIGGTFLDLGAGNQPFRPWYEGKAERIIAADAAPLPGLDVISFAAPLPFREGTFDSILCTSVLEHVDNAERTISEIARVLSPGGRLLITVPFLYPEHEAPYDFWRTTHHGLRSLLERHGLVVDNLSAQGGPVLMVAHFVVLALVQAFGLVSGKLGPVGRAFSNRITDTIIAAPQEAIRTKVSYELSPLARIASLGYMAAAHKPTG
jgi:SAM-dependent methyltransferase